MVAYKGLQTASNLKITAGRLLAKKIKEEVLLFMDR